MDRKPRRFGMGDLMILIAAIGVGIVGVRGIWLGLAASGRWRPERSWVDRLGRVLGVAWIAITILAAWPV